MSRVVEIIVSPSLSSLLDDPLEIKVIGLASKQPVTIAAGVEETGDQFVSYGHYVSDSDGCVDLTKAASLGGTFLGLHPMGLFWSLQEAKGQGRTGIRFRRKDANQPMAVKLSVIPDHVNVDNFHQLEGSEMVCGTVIQRHLIGKGVKRIPIRRNGIKGTLFVPQDGQRHPGVIDLCGSGGLPEYRAALLANRGFVTFALAYYAYEDLPGLRDGIKLEYFEAAIEFLNNLPSVFPGKLGAIGNSRGAIMVPFTAAISKKIKAAVLINPSCFNSYEVTYKNRTFDRTAFPWQMPKEQVMTKEGLVMRDITERLANSGEARVPITESKNAKYLLIHGEDDANTHPVSAKRLKDMCDEAGRNNCKLITYPGAGHLLEPPFLPVCTRSFNRLFGMTLWGGMTEPHAAAQEDMWRRIIDFFNRELRQEQSRL